MDIFHPTETVSPGSFKFQGNIAKNIVGPSQRENRWLTIERTYDTAGKTPPINLTYGDIMSGGEKGGFKR